MKHYIKQNIQYRLAHDLGTTLIFVCRRRRDFLANIIIIAKYKEYGKDQPGHCHLPSPTFSESCLITNSEILNRVTYEVLVLNSLNICIYPESLCNDRTSPF